MSQSPRIAISLGSSFLGYATHAGFLARLHQIGVRPVSVAGSSAGAIAAGLYAAGLDTDTIKKTVLSFALRRSFANKTPVVSHYTRITFNCVHVSAMHPRGAVAFLDAVVGGKNIEDLTAPTFMAPVSDLEGCRTLFLREGSLATAMVASCCVPTLMAPLAHAGIDCFDGGIAHETPIDPWLDDPGVDIIVAHRIVHPESAPWKFLPFNLFNTPGRIMSCVSEQLLDYRRRLAFFHQKKLLISNTHHRRPAMFSGKGMIGNYEAGEAEAQRFYDEELKPLLGG